MPNLREVIQNSTLKDDAKTIDALFNTHGFASTFFTPLESRYLWSNCAGLFKIIQSQYHLTGEVTYYAFVRGTSGEPECISVVSPTIVQTEYDIFDILYLLGREMMRNEYTLLEE
jgi:hypothetical protein